MVTRATFQMLNGHVWLAATILKIRIYNIAVAAESSVGQCFTPSVIHRQPLPRNIKRKLQHVLPILETWKFLGILSLSFLVFQREHISSFSKRSFSSWTDSSQGFCADGTVDWTSTFFPRTTPLVLCHSDSSRYAATFHRASHVDQPPISLLFTKLL